MRIRANSNRVSDAHEKPAEPARTSYPNGHPVKRDSFVGIASPAHHALYRSVGTRSDFPLTAYEAKGIINDLGPLVRAMELYRHLPPEERAYVSEKQFAVRCAMLEVLLRGKKT